MGESMWAQLIVLMVGVWLMFAPDVLGYAGAAANHDHIVGPLLASSACVALWEATRSLRWANAAIGVWMLIAPWVLGFGASATVNTALCGVAAIAFSLVRGRMKHSFGGGWVSLWRAPREDARANRTLARKE